MSKGNRSSSRGCGNLRRRTNFREPRQRFLIVCGGEKTEPNYFRAFHSPRVTVSIVASSSGPMGLVKHAERLRDGKLSESFPYDQVWCVFDRDEFSDLDFSGAIARASKGQIKVAYSNEAFEIWYLLHFDYHNTAITRGDMIIKLTRLLGHAYAKNSETMHAELLSRLPEALKNARRLATQYDPPNPVDDNPSTTVHLLVEELRKHAL